MIKPGDGFVHFARMLAMVGDDVAVGVPGILVADLRAAHQAERSALRARPAAGPSGTAGRTVRWSARSARISAWFRRSRTRYPRLRAHITASGTPAHRNDASGQLADSRMRFDDNCRSCRASWSSAARCWSGVHRSRRGTEIQTASPARTEHGSLVSGGQKPGTPVGGAGEGPASRVQNHNEGREVLVLAAQTVSDPGTDAGVTHLDDMPVFHS